MKKILFVILVLFSCSASAALVEVAHQGGMIVEIDLNSFAKVNKTNYMMRAIYTWDKPGHAYHAVAVTREYNCTNNTYRLMSEVYMDKHYIPFTANGPQLEWERAGKGTTAKILIDMLCNSVKKSDNEKGEQDGE